MVSRLGGLGRRRRRRWFVCRRWLRWWGRASIVCGFGSGSGSGSGRK